MSVEKICPKLGKSRLRSKAKSSECKINMSFMFISITFHEIEGLVFSLFPTLQLQLDVRLGLY